MNLPVLRPVPRPALRRLLRPLARPSRRHGMRLLLMGLLALLGCSSGARSYVHPNIDFSYMRRCAVLPFGNISGDNHAGGRVQAMFTMGILQEGALQVVEPGEVEAVMDRLRLPTGTDLTPEQYVQLGRELQVDALFTGTVEEYGLPRSSASRVDEVTASFAMVETQTGTIVWQAQVHKTGGSFWRSLTGSGSAGLHEVSRDAVASALGTLF